MVGWRMSLEAREHSPHPVSAMTLRTNPILAGSLAIGLAVASGGGIARAHPLNDAARPAMMVEADAPLLVLAKHGKHGKHHKWRGRWARHHNGWYYYPTLASPSGYQPGFVIPDAAPQTAVPSYPPVAAAPSIPHAGEQLSNPQPAPEAVARPAPQAAPEPPPPTSSVSQAAAATDRPAREAGASPDTKWGSRDSGPLTPLNPLSQPGSKPSPERQTAAPAKPAIQWQNPKTPSQ
jgi:hypothetical protein